MRFEDIAQCELGAIIIHIPSRRRAVLVSICGPPLKTIGVRYLEGDRERMEGCNPESFERWTLKAGALLRECESGQQAVLLEDSTGPNIQVGLILSGEKRETVLCLPEGTERRRMRVMFEIASAPQGTVVRTTPPQ